MQMLFTNEDQGVQGRVTELRSGMFSVTLMDLDSGEVLPYARHVKDLALATDLAKQWAGLIESPDNVSVSI